MLDFLEERKSMQALQSSEPVWKAGSKKSLLAGCRSDCALPCNKTPSKGSFRKAHSPRLQSITAEESRQQELRS